MTLRRISARTYAELGNTESQGRAEGRWIARLLGLGVGFEGEPDEAGEMPSLAEPATPGAQPEAGLPFAQAPVVDDQLSGKRTDAPEQKAHVQEECAAGAQCRGTAIEPVLRADKLRAQRAALARLEQSAADPAEPHARRYRRRFILLTSAGPELLAGSTSWFWIDGKWVSVVVNSFASTGYTADVTINY